jgi:ATP-binding cassette subfamily A (ABC1) protein 3
LADRIAVLASPGKLIASDTPVALKSTMGEGYSVSVKFKSDLHSGDLLDMIQTVIHGATLSSTDTSTFVYHLKSRDAAIVGQALRLVENSKQEFDIVSYDVLGTTIEDIFLDLLAIEDKEVEAQ